MMISQVKRAYQVTGSCLIVYINKMFPLMEEILPFDWGYEWC